MKRDAFFKQLETGLTPSAYSLRLREELEAHMDDAMRLAMLNGNTEEQAEENTLNDLGDPNEVKKEYNRTIRRMYMPSLLLEICMHIILIIPFTFLLIMNTVPLLGGGTSDLISIPIEFLLFGFLVCLYISIFKKIRLYLPLNTYIKWMGIVVLFPVICVFLYLLLMVIIPNHETNELFQEIPTYLLSFIAVTISHIGAGVLAEKIIQQRQNVLITSTKKRSRKNTFHLLFLAVFVLYLLITTIQPTWLSYALGHALYLPRSIVEFFVLKVLFGMLSVFISWSISFWIQVSILCFLLLFSLYGIYQYLRKKEHTKDASFPLLKICIALYMIVVLFFFGNWTEPEIEWKVPHSAISLEIEKTQTGPFFDYFKSLNADEGQFSYFLEKNPDGLMQIDQTSGMRYTLTSIEEIDQYHIQKSKGPEDRFFFSQHYTKLPEGVECKRPASLPGNLYSCYVLTYNGKEIYTQQSNPNEIGGILMSNDKKWMLINFTTGAYDPNYVYLVDVRGL